MEMIPKNGENRKFHDLEKYEMKANLGDFGVKKQAILRANSTYFALQCNLCSTSMQLELKRNITYVAPKGGFTEGHKEPFWRKEAAVEELI